MRLKSTEEVLLPEIRARYEQLKREGKSPRQAVEQIAKGRGESENIHYVRVLIGYRRPVKICKECWNEFRVIGKKPDLCHPCYKVYNRANKKKGDRGYFRRGRRFMTNDELRSYARHAFGMSTEQFGEALADVIVRTRAA